MTAHSACLALPFLRASAIRRLIRTAQRHLSPGPYQAADRRTPWN